MKEVFFKAIPWNKEEVTRALECGVDGLLVEQEHAEIAASLARVKVVKLEDAYIITLGSKQDEENAAAAMRAGNFTALAPGWEIIPVENLLAQSSELGLEVANLQEARLAFGILECGVRRVIVLPSGLAELKNILEELRFAENKIALGEARITEISPAGLGHRVCLDTISILRKGQGFLVGDASTFNFLVHAETESNPYVAARPFRVNAGAAHAYIILPKDQTAYLGELVSGREVLGVDCKGNTSMITIGRVKIEVRPMLRIRAVAEGANGLLEGGIFLQNAETVRLTKPDGEPISVVKLAAGDRVLCRIEQSGPAGRHFGMRIAEDIREV